MRYALLGSTALLAAGLVAAGPAKAADNLIKLGIGGWWYGIYGSNFDTEDSGTGGVSNAALSRGDVARTGARLRFQGSATADNGLEYGVRVDYQTTTQAGNMGESPGTVNLNDVYGYVSGGFGAFFIGDRDDATNVICYDVPSAAAGTVFGADTPETNFSNAGVFGHGATNGSCGDLSGHATKIMYQSPSFGGFDVLIGYAPDGARHDRGTGTTSDSQALGGFQDSEAYSAVLEFNRTFGSVDVTVAGGGTWIGDTEGTGIASGSPSGPEDYHASARLGFGLGDGKLVIGGVFRLTDNLRSNIVVAGPGPIVGEVTHFDDSATDIVFGAGVTYNVDAWTVGLGWTQGQYESTCNQTSGGGSPGPGAVISDNHCTDYYNIFSLTGDYMLAPGVDFIAAVEYYDYDSGQGINTNNGGATNDQRNYEAIAAGGGIRIGF